MNEEPEMEDGGLVKSTQEERFFPQDRSGFRSGRARNERGGRGNEGASERGRHGPLASLKSSIQPAASGDKVSSLFERRRAARLSR